MTDQLKPLHLWSACVNTCIAEVSPALFFFSLSEWAPWASSDQTPCEIIGLYSFKLVQESLNCVSVHLRVGHLVSPAGFEWGGKGGDGSVKLPLPPRWLSTGSRAGGAVGRQGIKWELTIFSVYFKGVPVWSLFLSRLQVFLVMRLFSRCLLPLCVFLRR